MTTTPSQIDLSRRYNHASKLLQEADTLLKGAVQDGDCYLVDATLNRAATLASRSLVLAAKTYLHLNNGQQWADAGLYHYGLNKVDVQLSRVFSSAFGLLRLISKYEHHMSAEVVQIGFDQAHEFVNCIKLPVINTLGSESDAKSYVDPYLFESGLYKDRADYDKSIERVRRINQRNKRLQKQSKSSKDLSTDTLDELGLDPNEPYLNPDPNDGFFLYEGKWYTRDKNGKMIRYYPSKATLPATNRSKHQ